MFIRRSAVVIAALVTMMSFSSSVIAAPEELNDLAKSNIRVVIDFLRVVGHFLEADNIQAWLDAGKIKMDEDLGDDTGAETDDDGNITIRKMDVAMVDLAGASRIQNFQVISELAALLAHEKVHAHQTLPNWILEIRFKLSTSTDIWELEAYYREIELRVEWHRWLVGEYVDEVRVYNPKVRAFNAHARAIAAGQEPDKATMRELLGPIRQETEKLIDKKGNIRDMIIAILNRAEVLKKANFEKGNYWYDQMKDEWEQYLQKWKDNLHILGTNRERGGDWAEWLEQDPPPLPELLDELTEPQPKNAPEVEAAFRAVAAQREAWERQTDSEKVQDLMPFLERVAAALPPSSRVNIRVYLDVTYRVYYNRVEQTLGIEVRNGTIVDATLPGYPAVEETVWVPESAILRVLIADDAAAAFEQEVAAGHIRFEPEKSVSKWLLPLLGMLLLLTLGALAFALRTRR